MSDLTLDIHENRRKELQVRAMLLEGADSEWLSRLSESFNLYAQKVQNQQATIDKLVEGIEEILTVFPACNGWYFDNADEIAEKAQTLINSVTEGKKRMKLKPCPFCGGEAEYSWQEAGMCHPAQPDTVEFYCTDEDCGVAYFTSGKEPDEAIKAWNQRVKESGE